ncbi:MULTISPECIES: IS3 family transposase [unclassified Caballeronia]|uniref:IS3 family transposase n=1 Tax=unclassified Caballeronia TaxID=2646786 RepID=UPI002855436B|nr:MULTISPECIES: IS3 family transposase [unclassified Caballeronia]MDR5777036.1 IS3 family transposase [Caballeronia sp. LZ002]MDR5798589.1 IS3 family transposase [Caballeronia sp. LZ001]MDR5852520.1 IS3 family transposase [Caballeronia sp. LZ003]
MEVLTGPERRRRWSADEKLAMVRETFEPGKTVSMVARLHGINPNQLFQWRKLHQDGSLSAVSAGEEVVPASELSDALKQIKELQRLLGKKTMENEILREAVEVMKSPKMDCALTLITGGRPVKQVCDVLGVARSNVSVKLARTADWQDGRRARKTDDAGIVDEIRLLVADLPSYGYRRVWGLLRSERELRCEVPVNAKRVYRVMRQHDLLLHRRPARPSIERRHEGTVAVPRSNQRWCSDGFEFRCDNGAPLRVTFALDCCDREAISWAATTGGHSGDVVRDVMLAAVEHRFGNVRKTPAQIEWLSDNGSGYIAEKTRAFASDIGLKPLTTPVCSPQSNGMAESFVKTMKRDYVAFMPKPDAATAVRNLAVAFEHYNDKHPHSALKYRSPREFRRKADSSTLV